MKRITNFFYWNVPFVGKAIAHRINGDSLEFFNELSDRPVYNSPWGWHERIRNSRVPISYASKAEKMSQHNLWIFPTPILFSDGENVYFVDGSKGVWKNDTFFEVFD